MDPVSVIVAALAAGVAAGGRGAAEKAVKDAYEALRVRLGRLGAEPEVRALESDPPPTSEEIEASSAAKRLAARLRALPASDVEAARQDAEKLGRRVGALARTRPTLVAENSFGIQQGDHNTMTFTYPAPKPRSCDDDESAAERRGI
jgi:hypothetical protein